MMYLNQFDDYMYFKSIHEGLKGIKMSIVVQILILFGCS